MKMAWKLQENIAHTSASGNTPMNHDTQKHRKVEDDMTTAFNRAAREKETELELLETRLLEEHDKMKRELIALKSNIDRKRETLDDVKMTQTQSQTQRAEDDGDDMPPPPPPSQTLTSRLFK